MKKIIISLICVITTHIVLALTETVDGIEWTYRISKNEAIIGSGISDVPAISQDISGTISVPDSLGGYKVTIIGKSAFHRCTELTYVEIPNSVTNIEYGAFSSCSNLKNAILPDSVQTLNPYVFSRCSSLEKVILGEGIARIDYGVFENCNSLTNIVFMGNEAPKYCYDPFNAPGSSLYGKGRSYGFMCVVQVASTSKGWGETIPGTWKGCSIEYYNRVQTPFINAGSDSFINASQEISIGCETDSAIVLYTIDGSDPLENGLAYKRPFEVYKSCTVRAIAVKDDWKDSAEATATFTRNESLSEAANMYGYLMENDDAHPWTVATDVSHDGVSSARSGIIGNNETTCLQTSVKKAGMVSFWWRAACEEADEEYYDYGTFSVDGSVVARIAGHDGEWYYVSHEITGGGKHTLKWEYSKDGVTSYAPDCIWVDRVQWIPADGSGYTLTTPEPVPYSWLTKYGLGLESDFESAANALSGKMQGGKETKVWEEFVAGTDPTNETSVLTAMIEMQDGVPIITWEPNLNTNGEVRLYKVYGKETLSSSEDWAYPTNSLHRFFKVTVEMP